MTVQSSLQRVQSDAVEAAGACCQLNARRLQHYSMSVVCGNLLLCCDDPRRAFSPHYNAVERRASKQAQNDAFFLP